MLLAELIVRHTRRHMPTRRVALENAYLPTSGPAHGSSLLAAVLSTNLPAVDDDEFAAATTSRVDELLHEISRLAEATRTEVLAGESREPLELAAPAEA